MTNSSRKPPAGGEGTAPSASPTQSLDRAMALLEAVVLHAGRGAALGRLAEQTGLSKPTAHRLLTGLRQAGMVDYDVASRLFLPAFKLYQMGQVAGERFNVIHLARPSLERLADATGDAVYLAIRSGDYLNCVARALGDYPIKTLTLSVGDVRPLGLGSNGLVLLAALPEPDRERIIERHRETWRAYPLFDPLLLREYLQQTREQGYGFNEGLMLPEMSAIAIGIKGPHDMVDASISVACISSRMRPARRETILGLLRKEVEAIEQLMRAYPEVKPRNPGPSLKTR